VTHRHVVPSEAIADAPNPHDDAYLRALFDHAAIGLARVEFAGARWLEVNDAFCRLVGYPRDDLLGTPWPEITHPDDIDADLVPFRRMAAGELDSYVVEKRFIHRDGHHVWARLTLSVVRDALGHPWYEVAVIEDITERRAAAEERERLLAAAERARSEAERQRADAEEARARAEEANRAKSSFLAAMSHELRTPLNAIAGHVHLLALGIHGAVTPAQEEAYGRVQKAQRHLLAVINDVLNFARIEAGRVEYDVRPVALHEVVQDVLPLVEPQVASRGLVLDAAPGASGASPIVAHADREKLGQVLLNLLTNAAKFTPPVRDDGTAGRITIDATDGGDGTVRLHVRDTGIGIPLARQGAIFDPFVQVHEGLTRAVEGTGLGLAISRDLARGMGGELTVHSAPGEGAEFTVTLPRADG
jgi:PAS domain S-box-containing protein